MSPGSIGISGAPDFADSSIYTLWYGGPSLGLPNRDYYWDNDAANEPIRESLSRRPAPSCSDLPATTRSGRQPPRRSGSTTSKSVWPNRCCARQTSNDPANYYHPRPWPDLIAANPDFDWPAFLEILGIADQETVVVTEETYLDTIDEHRQLHRSGDDQGLPHAAGALEHGRRADRGDGRHRLLLLRHRRSAASRSRPPTRSRRSARSMARSAKPLASSTSRSTSRRRRRRRSRNWSTT